MLFNIFLNSKIKPTSLDDGKSIPHKERSARNFNFEVDIEYHDRNAPRVLKITETTKSSTTSTTSASETASEPIEDNDAEDTADVEPAIPANPLLAQLQKKEGIVQTAQLIDRVRYLIAENPDESIPKRYADNTTVPDVDFMITPEVDCVRKDLVIFVKSRVESSGLREIIRNTWAHTHAIEKWSIATIFLVGKSDSKYLNRNLQNEGRDKQDLLVGDYIDDYQNLTAKSVSGLQWFTNECLDAKNYLSVDDDVFPDLPLILGFLNKNENSQVELACLYNYIQHARVTRKGKWQTSWESYGKEFYPVYCEGACYSMPRWAAVKLFKNAQVTFRDAPVDDAFLTGVLREKAGLIPKQVQNKRMCKHLVNDDEIIQKLRAEWAKHEQ